MGFTDQLSSLKIQVEKEMDHIIAECTAREVELRRQFQLTMASSSAAAQLRVQLADHEEHATLLKRIKDLEEALEDARACAKQEVENADVGLAKSGR